MGRAARKSAEERYSWPVIVQRYEELWEESLQIAKCARWDESRAKSLFHMSLEKSFGHFATGKLHSNRKCFITAEGQEWLKRPDRFYFLCQSYSSAPAQRFNQMLRSIADHPGIAVSKVIEAFGNNINEKTAANAHWSIARLFKYGLVASTQECGVIADQCSAVQTVTHDFRSSAISSTVPPEGSRANA
jgi:hypothetical protein